MPVFVSQKNTPEALEAFCKLYIAEAERPPAHVKPDTFYRSGLPLKPLFKQNDEFMKAAKHLEEGMLVGYSSLLLLPTSSMCEQT